MMKFKEFFNIIGYNDIQEKWGDTIITSFEIYTQYVKANGVYFHWKIGEENTSLIEKACRKGALVVTSDVAFKNTQNKNVIYVPSVRKTLEKVAAYKRNNFQGEVIAITGSTGKSTIKNMLSHILSMTDRTIATAGNENAWLGIYCTLCNISENTQYVVLETGASGPKTLSIPIQIVKPTMAVLLDVEFSHQEKYENFEDLLKEKSSIIEALQTHGTLIINFETYEKLISQGYIFKDDIQLIKVSHQNHICADYHIKDIKLYKHQTQVEVLSNENKAEIIFIQQGNYANGLNAVYAWVLCKALNKSLAQFNSLIKFYQPLSRRFERLRICDSDKRIYEFIDDAYNSSPLSILSLLKSLQIRKPKRKILILGDMLELGEQSIALHQRVLESSELSQFDYILLYGDIFGKCIKPINALYYTKFDQLLNAVDDLIQTGDLVAIKASHGMNFFAVRKFLEKNAINISDSKHWFIDDEFLVKEESNEEN